jgi:hypothetical protein
MNNEIVLDFDNQKNLIEEINKEADSLNLQPTTITDSTGLLIIKYTGTAEGIFSLGKYIGEKGYSIDIASK